MPWEVVPSIYLLQSKSNELKISSGDPFGAGDMAIFVFGYLWGLLGISPYFQYWVIMVFHYCMIMCSQYRLIMGSSIETSWVPNIGHHGFPILRHNGFLKLDNHGFQYCWMA